MKEDLQQQLLTELVIESLEGLDAFDQELLALERGEQNEDTWNNTFRIIHTIKGSSGCLGLGKVETVAHAGESLLTVLRDGKLAPDTRIVSSLLRYSDALRQMMARIEETGEPGSADHSQLIHDLQALHAGISAASQAEEGFGFFGIDTDIPVAAPASTPVVTAKAGPAGNEFPAPELPVVSSAPSRPSVSENAIRVDIGQIDRLMNLVGELVLARNQIVQYAGQHPDPALLVSVQRVNLITSELQESVMKTRMQPIGNIWSKIPRMIRDLCLELGKDVALTMEGNETELDRTIIEAIKDPLTHIIRNAIDHGIEQPAQRKAAGKSGQGRLGLRAFHEGGQVNIEIRDDGAGIDGEQVLRKAIQRGAIGQEQAAKLSPREILNLVFLPGVSTAEKITNVSGRGVGMDVVKNNIEKIGGSVDIQSERGKRTVIRIRIPLTLAIIPALVVTCGGDRYAIPAASLVELVRIEGDQVDKFVEHIHSAPVYRLRGNLLPLVHLAGELDVLSLRKPEDAMFLVVLQAEGQQFGLVVDGVNDTEEIVVKPLGTEMKGLAVFAGATIMGDGKVALILDILGLARRAALLNDDQQQAAQDLTDAKLAAGDAKETHTLLVARAGGNRIGIPLSYVARLEEIPAERIERAGNTEVVQYRGRIMNVIRLGEVLGYNNGNLSTQAGSDIPLLRLIVCALETKNIGLIVDAIEDIVEETTAIERRKGHPGILGSTVIQQRVTDIIDVEHVVGMVA